MNWLAEHWSAVVGVVGGVSGFVLPPLFNHRQNQKLERLKIKLGKEKFEHEVQFKQFHEKAATELDTMYKNLTSLIRSLKFYFATVEYKGEPTRSERLATAIQDFDKYKRQCLDSRLYMSDDLDATNERIAEIVSNAIHDFKEGLSQDTNSNHWKKAQYDIEQLIAEHDRIRRLLRKTLGFER